MTSDPIVQEVCSAGKEVAEAANGDLRGFFAIQDRLKKNIKTGLHPR
jgi:hypothetical protein